MSEPNAVFPRGLVITIRLFWLLSLIPWFVFALPGAGVAFDGGYDAEAYVFASSILTYPLAVLLAVFLCRWKQNLIFLPLLNLVGVFASGLLHRS